MPDINQLSQASPLSLADQFALFSSANGDARRASLTALLALLQANVTLPSGLFSASGLYSLGAPDGVGTGTVIASAALTPIALAPTIYAANILPTGAASLASNAPISEFVATRDISAPFVCLNMAMTFAAARRLTLAIQTGPAAGLYDTPLQWTDIGRDATQMYANISGFIRNPNNLNGKILAGERIRMSWKYDIAGATAITVQSLTMKIQTTDGI